MVAPHFLMELHVSLTAASPAARWVEYIPQLDAVARSRVLIAAGEAVAPDAPGLGIDWRWDEIERRVIERHRCSEQA
jgi:L-alanine-DL-glutamate epimerase-like enolase superfamily enzyme